MTRSGKKRRPEIRSAGDSSTELSPTPSRKKGRGPKNSNKTPSPASSVKSPKFLTPKQRKDVMKLREIQNDLTENERDDTTARKLFEDNSTELKVDINNSMWPFVSECHLEEVDGKQVLILRRNQVNHNTVTQKIVNEIANNFLGNPLCVDSNEQIYPQDIGTDMECLLAWNDKVNALENSIYIL